jgi:hypothetical protein
MKRIYLIITALVIHSSLFAQREYNVCDSTFYTLNNDTTIVAGKRNLYVYANSVLSPLYNFTTTDTNEYIRDFDIVNPNLWYTIVGSRYIGSPTQLYKSVDQGQAWTLDTAHFNASNAQTVSPAFLRSINNLQHIDGDTLIMFMYYYESGIIYSTDAGATWTKWFDNLIAHYQGMFSCGDNYYLFGFEGDAFRPWMFRFDKYLLFSPDTNGAWNSFSNMGNHPQCSTTFDSINCIYPPFSLSRCEQYNYFKNYIDSLCLSLDINNFDNEIFSVYPNPASQFLTIRTPFLETATISIFNVYGNKMSNESISKLDNEYNVDLQNHPTGLYFVHLKYDKKAYLIKYIKN